MSLISFCCQYHEPVAESEDLEMLHCAAKLGKSPHVLLALALHALVLIRSALVIDEKHCENLRMPLNLRGVRQWWVDLATS